MLSWPSWLTYSGRLNSHKWSHIAWTVSSELPAVFVFSLFFVSGPSPYKAEILETRNYVRWPKVTHMRDKQIIWPGEVNRGQT